MLVEFRVCSHNASSAGAYSGYREGVEYGALLRENFARNIYVDILIFMIAVLVAHCFECL